MASVGILKPVIGIRAKARARGTSGGKVEARATVRGFTLLEAAPGEKARNADRGVDPGGIILS
jgi:hypothetical protein